MIWNIFKKKKKKSRSSGKSELIDSGQLRVVIRTDLGNIRTNNEDMGLFYKIADEQVIREKGYLLLVADGMGGHQAGEVASRMASEIIGQEYFKDSKNGGTEKTLRRAFENANQKIFQSAAANRAQQGMGTTCTAIVVIDEELYFAHVGDSRAYLYKDGKVTRITTDHTYVQELVKSGEITAEEAENHPKRNILTNAMGTKPEVKVDTGICPAEFSIGNKLMLCSDGLYDYLNDQEIGQYLNQASLAESAEIMINEAKKRGGHDNITIVLAEKVSGQQETTTKETRDIDLPATKEFDLP